MGEQTTLNVTAIIEYWDDVNYEKLLQRYMEDENVPEYVVAINGNYEIIGIEKLDKLLFSARNKIEMLMYFMLSNIRITDRHKVRRSLELVGKDNEKTIELTIYLTKKSSNTLELRDAYDKIYSLLSNAKLNVVRVAIPSEPSKKQRCIRMCDRGFYGVCGEKMISKVYNRSFESAKEIFEEQKHRKWTSYIANKETHRRIFLVGPCIANYGVNLKCDCLPVMLQSELEQLGYEINIICISVDGNPQDEIYALFKYTMTNHDLIFVIDREEAFTDYEIKIREAFDFYQGEKWLYYDTPIHATIYGQQIIIDKMLKQSIIPWLETCGEERRRVLFCGNELVADKNDETIQKNVNEYIQSVKKLCKNVTENCRGAIVMNANPFTLGHRHLVEKALEYVKQLIIFVVEEDCSYVPFKDRFELVKQGVSDLNNVVVVPSGNYIISSTTFLSYFEKETKREAVIDAAKDIDIFGRWIAPALGIVERFVGEEPKDFVTRQYNEQMKERLPHYGVQVIEIPRMEAETLHDAISASTVRSCLKYGNYNLMEQLVPVATFAFLQKNYERLERRKVCSELIEHEKVRMGREPDEISNLMKIVEIIGQNEMTVIYGTGIDALMIMKELPTEYLNRIRFCDQRASEKEYQFMNTIVSSPASIANNEKVIIASRKFMIEIFSFCVKTGIPVENLILLESN